MNFVENIGKSFLSAGNYILQPYGIYDDVAYVFSKDFGQDLYDIGKSIGNGDIFAESWNWMSEDRGMNWVAFGKTSLNTGLEIL